MSKVAKQAQQWMAEGDQWWFVSTPFGRMLLCGGDDALHHVLLPNSTEAVSASLDDEREGCSGAVAEAERQLREYFAGERLRFDLPLDPSGTAFQRAVWWALNDIGYGTTASYGEIAARVGKPTAFRAVGMANGANPLPVVLPCHRVIGANGKLVGFGGGLELKDQLLGHELRVLAQRAGPRP
jgi:methylated-DNA-[protein]-cysteine S-methyltransferase